MKALVLGLALALVSFDSAGAAKGCLTRQEARAAFPGAYLYWRTAQRCWYGRGGTKVPRIVPLPPVDEKQRAETGPPLFVDAERTVWAWDEDRRQGRVRPWAHLARFEAHLDMVSREVGPLFSTFQPGTEPDTWPQIETASPWKGLAAGALLALLLVAGAALVPVRVLMAVGVRP